MKHLLFFIFSFLFTASVFSQKFDTLTTYQWQNNAWQPDGRIVYTYNSSCLIGTQLLQEWLTDSSSWRNSALTTYTYTAIDSVNQATTQIWDTTSYIWVNALRQTYSYGANSKVSQLLTEIWDAGSSSWGNAAREIYSYNASNLVDSLLSQSWQSNAWVDLGLTTTTYNADNTVNQILTQFSLGVTWLNVSRVTYAYNADQTIHQTTEESADFLTQVWSNTLRNSFTYNAAKQVVTDTAQRWNSTQWQDSALTINTYSGSQLTNSLEQLWDDAQSLWANDAQSNITYNGDGTIAEIIDQNWNDSTSVWVNDTRATLSYTTGCALPVTLLDFTAALNGKVAQLQWTTVTEINTKNFIVQRSADGRSFENIGSVNAVGNSTQKTSYQFTDAEVLSKGVNKIYYRLQMMDKDGAFTYSKVAIINITPNGKMFVIYPNPVKDQLFATSSASLNNAEIRITDQSGKVVYSQQIHGVQAGVQNKVNVANLGKGVYYIQITTGSDVQTTKFFKY
jgi:hypothetical protein